MFNARVRFALDQFIKEDYFLPVSDTYHLIEKEDSGRSELIVHVQNENLCICNFDGPQKGKCNFLRQEKKYGLQKSVDHVLFEHMEAGWRLHLFEMKSGVGYKTWQESIKPKVRTSYFTALAIAEFLGIRICECIVYTTYENEKFNMVNQGTNPKTMIPRLGCAARDPYEDEWKKNRIILNVGTELELLHNKVKMKRNPVSEVLEETLTI